MLQINQPKDISRRSKTHYDWKIELLNKYSKSFIRQSSVTVVGLLLFLIQILATNIEKSTAQTSECLQVNKAVALAPNQPKSYQIYGRLCGRFPLAGRTVQVLVSGNTYGSIYWEFPYQPKNYSYVNALTKAGYATFNIDRIGIGKSSRPDGDLVTIKTNSYVLNQINQALRNGEINNIKFERIINVGHSFGSLVVINTASNFGGVDGVILTGFLHNLSEKYFQDLNDSIYPAQLDPRFIDKDLPDGYITTRPGTRAKLWYNESNADPKVIALDEATKETLTNGEVETGLDVLFSDESKRIDVPVLMVIGQNDYPFCTENICDNAENVAAFEASFFSPEAQLQTYVLQDAGHNINLELNAPVWFKVARQWSDKFVGTGQK